MPVIKNLKQPLIVLTDMKKVPGIHQVGADKNQYFFDKTEIVSGLKGAKRKSKRLFQRERE